MALMFFDYDGVLVDSLQTEAKYFAEACQEYGIDAVKNADDMAKLSEGNFYEELMLRGVTAEDVLKIKDHYGKIKTDGRYTIPAFDEMFELLRRVSSAIPTYIITSNMSVPIEERLKEYNISSVIDVMGADKEPSKVKKLKSIMDKYPGERTLFIGDTKGDMIEAREVGIDIRLGVTWGWQSPEVVLTGDPDYWFYEKQDVISWFDGFLEGIKF